LGLQRYKSETNLTNKILFHERVTKGLKVANGLLVVRRGTKLIGTKQSKSIQGVCSNQRSRCGNASWRVQRVSSNSNQIVDADEPRAWRAEVPTMGSKEETGMTAT
jgi:hypothetical protein